MTNSVPSLPVGFITDNSGAQTLSIAQTFDNSLAGTYIVTVTTTVTYRTSATTTTTNTLQTTQTITINVTGRCSPESLFTNTNFPSPLTYTLGEAGGDTYSFLFEYTTDPINCGTFPITYSLSGGPNMLTLDAALE